MQQPLLHVDLRAMSVVIQCINKHHKNYKNIRQPLSNNTGTLFFKNLIVKKNKKKTKDY